MEAAKRSKTTFYKFQRGAHRLFFPGSQRNKKLITRAADLVATKEAQSLAVCSYTQQT